MKRKKFKQEGYTLIEVIVSLMVMGLVFSIVLPGFYMTHLMSEKGLVDRNEASIERRLNLFFKKQVYQSDCICIRKGRIFLRDLESPEYYNIYGIKNDLLMRYKYKKIYDREGEFIGLMFMGSGGSGQFEKGLQNYALELADDNHIIFSYQLVGQEKKNEVLIEHGKKIIRIQ